MKIKLFEKAEDKPHVRILKKNLMLKDDLNLVDDLKGHKWRRSQIIAKILFKLGDKHCIKSHSTYVLQFPVFILFCIVLPFFYRFLSRPYFLLLLWVWLVFYRKINGLSLFLLTKVLILFWIFNLLSTNHRK